MPLVPSTIGRLGKGASAVFFTARDLVDRTLNQDVIRLAVTGLSRAGKTVFITSLLQNLLALSDGHDSLPALTRGLRDGNATRLKSVTILSPEDSVIPWFDYQSKLRQLEAASPTWPSPTDDLSEIALVLNLERKQPLTRAALGQRRIRLEILDYPGEWLLDLPLLKQTYQQWSRQTLQLLWQQPRRGCAREFMAYVDANIQPNAHPHDDLIRQAHRLYKQTLQACRAEYGLRYLQPGRFICPGPEGTERPFLWFFPMEISDGTPKPGTVAEQLIKRFERYKTYVTERFFEPHFNNFNRQIMLVDVLSALYDGRVAFEDTARAIADVARGLSTQKITHLAVAATMADHVPELARANLRELLQVLAQDATNAGRSKGLSAGLSAALSGGLSAAVTFRTVASINSTEEGTGKLEDRDVAVVKGLVDGKMRPYYVGQVPSVWPPNSFWDHKFLQLPNFQPRAYDPAKGRIEHLGLDVVLNDVIGDLL